MKTYSRRFVIDVYDDNLHLSHLLHWDKPVKEFFDSYKAEIRELEEDETVHLSLQGAVSQDQASSRVKSHPGQGVVHQQQSLDTGNQCAHRIKPVDPWN